MRARRLGTLLLLALLVVVIGAGCGRLRQRPKPPAPPAAEVPPKGGDFEGSVSVKGTERDYLLHLPTGFDPGKRYPLVMVFHGGGGNAGMMARQTGMSAKADREGFIVVYPDGSGRPGWGDRHTWNAGRCCGWAAKEQVDDMSFVRALLDSLEKRYPVDRKRIYATGHSNGAAFTYRLACQMADRIAAVAPVAGHDATDSCHPSRPVPVLHFHGLEDDEVPYTGEKCGGRLPGDPGWSCRSVPDYLDFWARLDGCSGAERQTYARGGARCVSEGSSCRGGAEVILCTVENGGHTWPGGEYASDARIVRRMVGPISSDVNATDMMWEFFSRHSLR